MSYHKFTHSKCFTAFLLAREACANLLYKEIEVSAPQSIGDYGFVENVPLHEYPGTHRVSLYQNRAGEKAIAKIWRAPIKNHDYYMMLREATVLELLSNVISRSSLSIPNDLQAFSSVKLLATDKNKNYLTVLTEYFDGENLSGQNVHEQIRVYLQSLRFLNTLENLLSAKEKSGITTRGEISFLLSYPVIACLALVRHPQNIGIILQGGVAVMRSIPALFKRRHLTTLVHQDLHTKNIMVRAASVKIIDVGNIVRGDVLSDVAMTVLREWQNVAFRDALMQKIEDEFFKNDRDHRAFYGLLAYHATHTLVMGVMHRKYPGCREILRLVASKYDSVILPTTTIKHIDVITKYFYPVAGGIENNIMQTYVALQNTFGWDVTIHTLRDTYTEKNVLALNETVNGLRVKRYGSDVFGFSPEINWGATDVVALHNFDVFFVRYLFHALLLKITGKKKFAFIVTPHGGFSPEWSMFPPISRFVKKIYTHTLGAWLINTVADGVRAVSEWERLEEVKYISSEKVHLIDNGLEDEAYEDIDALASDQVKKAVQSYGRYIIQVSRVYPIKNIETTIRALAHLPEDMKFVVVGQLQDAAYEQKLKNLTAELGLKERVIFTGVVRGIDKYYLMRHAVAMVHMALWESGCNVVREGMSQGIPCVVSNVYGLPGLIKDGVNGFCLPVHDDKKVAEKILWLLDPSNTTSVQEIKETNAIFGKGQSWKDVARRMDILYRNCMPKI